jgi:hypothetical protein
MLFQQDKVKKLKSKSNKNIKSIQTARSKGRIGSEEFGSRQINALHVSKSQERHKKHSPKQKRVSRQINIKTKQHESGEYISPEFVLKFQED